MTSTAPLHCIICACHFAGQALGACGCIPAHNCIMIEFDQFGPMVHHGSHDFDIRADVAERPGGATGFEYVCECGSVAGASSYAAARGLGALHAASFIPAAS